MTYEKFKTGMFRVFVGFTIILEGFVYIIYKNTGSDEPYLFVLFPVFLWGVYFFILWVIKGFLGKEVISPWRNNMTYENCKVGLTRLFIFITIFIEMKIFLFTQNRELRFDMFIFNSNYSHGFDTFRFETPTVMIITPIVMVVLFKICCWIVSGFYFGKGNQKF